MKTVRPSLRHGDGLEKVVFAGKNGQENAQFELLLFSEEINKLSRAMMATGTRSSMVMIG